MHVVRAIIHIYDFLILIYYSPIIHSPVCVTRVVMYVYFSQRVSLSLSYFIIYIYTYTQWRVASETSLTDAWVDQRCENRSEIKSISSIKSSFAQSSEHTARAHSREKTNRGEQWPLIVPDRYHKIGDNLYIYTHQREKQERYRGNAVYSMCDFSSSSVWHDRRSANKEAPDICADARKKNRQIGKSVEASGSRARIAISYCFLFLSDFLSLAELVYIIPISSEGIIYIMYIYRVTSRASCFSIERQIIPIISFLE